MTSLGTKFSPTATKVLMLGSGELGKEVVIELQRLGVEVIACDRYANAPAMQVADRSHSFSMLDSSEMRRVIEQEQPDLIVPEIEAIATDTLLELEQEGFQVIPTAKRPADHEPGGYPPPGCRGIRSCHVPLSLLPTREEFLEAVGEVGIPCVVKPIMSSSGKGQSTIRNEVDIDPSWEYAQSGGRAGAGKVIVEGFVDFDYEITLLTVRHEGGVSYCEPIGHRQEDGDYRESRQPQLMSEAALAESKSIANQVTAALGGRGLFGVELFIKGDAVFFSEVSPRPHDTGMVTLISQDLSEFALHAGPFSACRSRTLHFTGRSLPQWCWWRDIPVRPPSVIYSRRSRKLTPRCAFLANRKLQASVVWGCSGPRRQRG